MLIFVSLSSIIYQHFTPENVNFSYRSRGFDDSPSMVKRNQKVEHLVLLFCYQLFNSSVTIKK